MRSIRIVTVGRPERGPWQALAEGYVRRISRRSEIALDAVRQDGSRRPSERRRREGAALLARVPRGSRVLVALDRGGRTLPSEEWGDTLARWQARGEVVFLVGGPDGLDETVLEAADELLSLGPLVFPHDLALLVLVEQLYRALVARENHPYGRH